MTKPVREYQGWCVVNNADRIIIPSIQPSRSAAIRNYLAWKIGYHAIQSKEAIREWWTRERRHLGLRVEKITINSRG